MVRCLKTMEGIDAALSPFFDLHQQKTRMAKYDFAEHAMPASKMSQVCCQAVIMLNRTIVII